MTNDLMFTKLFPKTSAYVHNMLIFSVIYKQACSKSINGLIKKITQLYTWKVISIVLINCFRNVSNQFFIYPCKPPQENTSHII